jgi:hypothetical protein
VYLEAIASKDLGGSGRDLILALYLHLPGGTEETHEYHMFGLAGASAEIRTEHFPNMKLEPGSKIWIWWTCSTRAFRILVTCAQEEGSLRA